MVLSGLGARHSQGSYLGQFTSAERRSATTGFYPPRMAELAGRIAFQRSRARAPKGTAPRGVPDGLLLERRRGVLAAPHRPRRSADLARKNSVITAMQLYIQPCFE